MLQSAFGLICRGVSVGRPVIRHTYYVQWGEKDDVRKINVVMDQQRNHGRWSGAVGMAGPPTKKKNEQRERGAMDRQTDTERE